MPHPDAAHAARRNAAPLFSQFIRDAMLAPRRLLDRHRHNGLLEIRGNAVAEIGLAAANLTEGLFAARVVQLLETIEAVTAVAHHLARLRDVPKLLGEHQHAYFGLDDLLLSRHALSMSDCQITS
jgi:hypothetical protein